VEYITKAGIPDLPVWADYIIGKSLFYKGCVGAADSLRATHKYLILQTTTQDELAALMIDVSKGWSLLEIVC
jgi:hypothetical protein